MATVIRPPAHVRFGRLALLALVWCTLTGGVFSGCRGLFTPAVPEPPSDPPIVPNFRSPEATLNTMRQGLAAKARGASAWLGAFADSTGPGDGPAFHQFFDPADLAFFQGACQCQAPSDWRVNQEQDFFVAFLDVRPADDYQVEFTVVDANPDPPPTDTQAILHRRYRVLAVSPDGSGAIVIATGYADLTFTKLTADDWLITRWDDHVDPEVGVNPSDPYLLSLGRRRLESTR